MPGAVVRIERVTVRCDRVCALVRCAPQARYTTPALAERAGREFPSLARHACVNSKGPRFGDVWAETSVPHLLEHLVIDLQTRLSAAPRSFVGTTEWLNEGEGLARVEVSYADDLVALRAFSEALAALQRLLS